MGVILQIAGLATNMAAAQQQRKAGALTQERYNCKESQRNTSFC